MKAFILEPQRTRPGGRPCATKLQYIVFGHSPRSKRTKKAMRTATGETFQSWRAIVNIRKSGLLELRIVGVAW